MEAIWKPARSAPGVWRPGRTRVSRPLRDRDIFYSCDLLLSWEPQTCDLVTVWTAVAKSQVPRPCGPSCDSVLFASTAVKVPEGGRTSLAIAPACSTDFESCGESSAQTRRREGSCQPVMTCSQEPTVTCVDVRITAARRVSELSG